MIPVTIIVVIVVVVIIIIIIIVITLVPHFWARQNGPPGQHPTRPET